MPAGFDGDAPGVEGKGEAPEGAASAPEGVRLVLPPGVGVPADIPEKNIREVLRTAERAVRWGMTPADREEWRNVAKRWMNDRRARISLRALALLAAVERQDQADQHLEARLQNTGIALLRARTVETPDGTRVQEVTKVWGAGAPTSDV